MNVPMWIVWIVGAIFALQALDGLLSFAVWCLS